MHASECRQPACCRGWLKSEDKCSTPLPLVDHPRRTFGRVLWDMEYSMVLTKAAFLHAEYLELYSGVVGENFRGDNDDAIRDAAMVDAMVQTRAYVDSHRNCEDIAMQMVRGTVFLLSYQSFVDYGSGYFYLLAVGLPGETCQRHLGSSV